MLLTSCGSSEMAGTTATVVEHKAPAMIALTFDVHTTTYSAAFPVMDKAGLVGTYYVDPGYLIDGKLPAAHLAEMKAKDWSIQGYSGRDMEYIANELGPDAARVRILFVKDTLASYGFPITSLAPSSRKWNTKARDVAAGIYETVRVGSLPHHGWQAYPFPDPLFIDDGGTQSLDDRDTTESLAETLSELQRAGACGS